MKNVFPVFLIMLVCFINGLAQSSGKATVQEKKDLLKQMTQDSESFKTSVDDFLGGTDGALKAMTVTKTDLNGDGQPEYIIGMRDEDGVMCMRGNCPNWVYGKSGSMYKLLAESASDISLLKTSTMGYHDLSETYEASGAFEVSTLKYDGSRYQSKLTQCYMEKTVNKKSKRVPIKCEE